MKQLKRLLRAPFTFPMIVCVAICVWIIVCIINKDAHHVRVNHTGEIVKVELTPYLHEKGDYVWVNTFTMEEDDRYAESILCVVVD
jgi:hypothetical protein